jgi:hypothetical protein
MERLSVLDAADVESPLKPEELQVLRDQYEKEGEYVGLQTKFNYAWVRIPPLSSSTYPFATHEDGVSRTTQVEVAEF